MLSETASSCTESLKYGEPKKTKILKIMRRAANVKEKQLMALN